MTDQTAPETGPATPQDGYAVVHDAVSHRYEARSLDGEVLGTLDYQPDGGRVVYPSTYVEPEHEGRGIASALARRALDDAREAEKTIVPLCSFVEAYVARHPEYQDLLAAADAS